MEESLNEGCEVENYEIATDECGDEIEEVKGVESVNKVNNVADTVDSTVELQGLNVHHWLWIDLIDRSHDEWYERDRRFFIVVPNCYAENIKTFWVDPEKFWELLIQRGFDEIKGLHEPRSTRHVYLTVLQFYRFVFDSGGKSNRFEDESFQEGGNDARSVTLFYSSKRVKNQMHFKFKYRRFSFLFWLCYFL